MNHVGFRWVDLAMMQMVMKLQLSHLLIIAGVLLVVTGFIGSLVNRRKADAGSDEPIEAPKAQMPPLPKLLDSSRKTAPKSANNPPT